MVYADSGLQWNVTVIMLLICRLVYTCWSRIQMSRSVCLFLRLNSLSMKFSMNLWHHLLCVRFDLMFRSGANIFQRPVYLSVKNLLSVRLSMCLPVFLSFCRSIFLCQFVIYPICLSLSIWCSIVCLSVFLSVCLSLSFYVHLLLLIRGGKSTKILYSSKSTITLLKFYLSTSKSTSLKIYSSKSKK